MAVVSPEIANAFEPSADAPDSADEGGGDGAQHLAWLIDRSKGREQGSYEFLLLLRFCLINMFAIGLLALAYVHGYVHEILIADQTHLVVVIFGVFLAGLVLASWKVAQTSRELNRTKEFDPMRPSRAALYLSQVRGRTGDSRAMAASALRLKLSHRIGVIRNLANSLIFLGLIGTVIGFIIALSGVDPEHVSDVEAISPMIANLIDGISVALYTTLVGAVLNIWLMANYHMLASGTVNLITAIVELGESRARA